VAVTKRWAVVVKPPGMLSVPGKGPEKADCAAARVALLFPRASGPLVVHRLDMETSGLLLFGLDEQSQRKLSRQFERRVVEKRYVALLGECTKARRHEGTQGDPLMHEAGQVSLPIRPDIDNRPIQIVDPVHGRESISRWRVLAREIDRVRVEFEPITGRTHQLRVHAAAGLGHPILGDLLYGGEPAERLMLHASMLSFLDPETGRRVELRSEPPF
jgi:tRNA pseudouridine32 synthase / 23S rRNA pseudouridine746 synthase